MSADNGNKDWRTWALAFLGGLVMFMLGTFVENLRSDAQMEALRGMGLENRSKNTIMESRVGLLEQRVDREAVENKGQLRDIQEQIRR